MMIVIMRGVLLLVDVGDDYDNKSSAVVNVG